MDARTFFAAAAAACEKSDVRRDALERESADICKAAVMALLSEDEIRRVRAEKKAAGVPCVDCATMQHVAHVMMSVLHGVNGMVAADDAAEVWKSMNPDAHPGPMLALRIMKEHRALWERVAKVLHAEISDVVD